MICAFAAVVIMGWNVLILLFPRNRFRIPEQMVLSYGLGIGLISLEMFLYGLWGVGFSLAKILLPWIGVIVVNIYLSLARRKEKGVAVAAGPEEKRARSIFYYICACGISFEIFYAFFRALIKPLESYDAIAIYAIKAKILYLARGIPHDFFTSLGKVFPHPDYPLGIPLAEVFVYLFVGNMNDQLVKVIFPLFFVSILVLLYYAIRRFAGSAYALFFVFLLASIPQFNAYATNAYLDLPLAYYVFAGSLLFFFWLRERSEIRYLLLSALFAALAGWTKNEGTMYALINIFLLAIYYMTRRRRHARAAIASLGIYAFIVGAVSLPWWWAKKAYHIVNSDIVFGAFNLMHPLRQLYKIGPIVYEFQKQLFGPKKWNVIWFIVLFAAWYRWRKATRGVNVYVALLIICAVGGYLACYTISHVEINYFLSKTWSRFLLHFLPVVVYWLARTLREDIKL